MEEEGINLRERQEALAKFRESLSLPLTERYYEEDELIDLFDYASDFNDDYLRMEVLMCAARFYPNSEELLERKAIFYSQYSDEVMEKCVEDNAQSTGVIWDIMRARNSGLVAPDARIEALDTILSKYDQFNDEEIIQFVGLASYFEQEQWLKDNLDLLQQKAIFPAVPLYEAALVLEMSGDTDFAIEMLERLTDLEPFNPDFWVVLSKEYLQIEQLEKSLSALEYAIAIDPANSETLYLKAHLLYMMGGDQNEVLSLMERIESLDGMNREMLRLIGVIYRQRGEIPRALEVYERFIQSHPEQSAEALLDMLSFAPWDIAEILGRIYSIDNNLSHWLSWAEEFESIGAHELSASLLYTYCNRTQVLNPPFQMIELAFRLGKFDLTYFLLNCYVSQDIYSGQSINIDSRKDILYYTVCMITNLKLGNDADVLKLMYEIKERELLSKLPDVKERVTMLGYKSVFDSILKIFSEHSTNYDWGTFDPFGFWSVPDDSSESEKE